MWNLLTRYSEDERGVAGIEYGLIAAMMAIVVIATISVIAPAFVQVFVNIGNKLRIN